MSTRVGWLLPLTIIIGTASISIGAFWQQPTFISRIDSVRVDVLVTDGREPIVGLRPADFEVRDNGVPQVVDLMAFETIPLNVMLAFDLSSSVTGTRLEELRAASLTVAGALRPNDRAALLTFNNTISLRTPLTADLARLRAALDQLHLSGIGDDTALVDASYSALVLGESDAGRSLLIVFSDGADTASFLTPAAVLETAKRSDVVVYSVESSTGLPTHFLEDLCALTGGRALHVTSSKKVAETFGTIFDEFRHRYLISYTPRGVSKDGWHRLDVRVKNRRATVKARPGYLAAF